MEFYIEKCCQKVENWNFCKGNFNDHIILFYLNPDFTSTIGAFLSRCNWVFGDINYFFGGVASVVL